MHKSKHYKDTQKDTNTSKAELSDSELFRKEMESSAFIFDKDTTSQPQTKQNKFLNYRLIIDACYCASDKLFYNSGIPKKTIKSMQQGSIPIDATIDLHGQTLEEACISLANFIYYHQQKNYIHIIHGKGYNANNMSKLKTQVASYLQDHPQINAFCSTPPNMGGTGAVIAKIKHK